MKRTIATYARKESELREDIEEEVNDCKQSYFGIGSEKDFFKKWECVFAPI